MAGFHAEVRHKNARIFSLLPPGYVLNLGYLHIQHISENVGNLPQVSDFKDGPFLDGCKEPKEPNNNHVNLRGPFPECLWGVRPVFSEVKNAHHCPLRPAMS